VVCRLGGDPHLDLPAGGEERDGRVRGRVVEISEHLGDRRFRLTPGPDQPACDHRAVVAPEEGDDDNGEYDHWFKYGYYTPSIYPFALNKYFLEGAYDRVSYEEYPFKYDPCTASPYIQCYDLQNDEASPLNLYDADPVISPEDAEEERDLYNETVEMGVGITFDANAQITSTFPPTEITWTSYFYDDVLRRTIIHEMGHALLANAEGTQHCTFPDCIMGANTMDWELHPFGTSTPGGCEHSPGETREHNIREKVHNSIHSQ